MKTRIIFCLVASLLWIACDDEDTLSPSMADTDRVMSQIDMEHPVVKRIYDDFGVGLLYEYNDTLDFTYVAATYLEADKWGTVDIPQIKSRFADENGELPADSINKYKAYVDGRLTFIDTTLFKYFDPNGIIATKMPYKVLLSENVFSETGVTGLASRVLRESESRVNRDLHGSLHSVFNDHSHAFKVKEEDVAVGTSKYIKDNFYAFLSRIIDMHKLYELAPDEFYGNKDLYYGKTLAAVYREENGMEEEEELEITYFPKEWLFEKGFIDAEYFYDITDGLPNTWARDKNGNYMKDENGNYIYLEKALLVSDVNLAFVEDRSEDLRSYLVELMYRNVDELEAFPENIQQNLMIVLNLITEWGVDLESINPELKEFKSNQ